MKWLFLVHQIQTPNSRERVKVWRLTRKVGAVLYRNSVYVLPYSKERLEDFHWLCQQIRDTKGEASVFISEANGRAEDRLLRQLFDSVREAEYGKLKGRLESHIRGFRQSVATEVFSAAHRRALDKDLNQLEAAFQEIQRVDFFDHPLGGKIGLLLKQARSSLSETEKKTEGPSTIRHHKRSDFRQKVWATRKHIHIDRLCSAWLIRKFIDPVARFAFASEKRLPAGSIPFDVFGAQFSHHGDRCTFETLVETFQIKDRAVATLAELVHDIDLKDHKYGRPEAEGLDMIVRAISDSLGDDHRALHLGSQVLDALYDRFSSPGDPR